MRFIFALILGTCLLGSAIGHAEDYIPLSENQTEISLSHQNRRFLLNYGRWILDGKTGKNPLAEAPKVLRSLKVPIILSVFSEQGVLKASKRIDDKASNSLEKVERALAELEGVIPSDYLHILVVSYQGRFPNFGIKGIFQNKVFEPRVTGMAFELNGRRAELNPIETLTLNLNDKGARRYLARKLNFDPKLMPGMNDLQIEIYRAIHFGEAYPDHGYANFYRGHKWFSYRQVSQVEVQNRLKLVGNWFRNNVIDDEVTYRYGPTTDKYFNEGRTMVRSTMAAWSLNKLAWYLDDPELKELGSSVINFYAERLFQMEASLKNGVIQASDEPFASGDLVTNRWAAASFLMAAMLERKSEKEKWMPQIELLYQWMQGYQRPDGVFWTQWGQSQYFMPGQALLSVSLLYQDIGDEKYGQFLEKSFDAYLPALQQMMVLGPKDYAPYAPAAYTLPATQMFLKTQRTRYKQLVFDINDRVSLWYDRNQRFQTYLDYDGNLEPTPGFYGDNALTAAALDALVDAAIVAKASGDEKRMEKYQAIIQRAVAYLLRLQYTAENTYYIKSREKVLGGFKKDLVNNTVWIDSVWQVTNALIKIQENKLLD